MNGDVSGLLGLLYETLLSTESWGEFLSELCRHTGCDQAVLAYHDFENRAPAIARAINLAGDVIAEWEGRYGKLQPRAAEMRRVVMARGWWVSANSWNRAEAAYRRSEYGEWLHERDLYHSIVGAAPVGRGFVSLNLIRPKSGRPFRAKDVAAMEMLVPHVRRVCEVQERQAALRARAEAGGAAMDQMDAGVIAVDGAGRVVTMNRAAEAIVRSGRGPGVREGRLVGGGSLPVVEMPLDSGQGLVFVCDPAVRPAPRAGRLRRLFGLTPAEARLADLLHQVTDLRQAAEAMGITVETARFMVKRIFAKTNTRGQGELLKMMGRLPGEE